MEIHNQKIRNIVINIIKSGMKMIDEGYFP